MEAKIEVCSATEGKTGLFLVNFTNGQLKLEKDDDVCAPRFACYQSTLPHRQNQRTMVCETENMQYIGHNTGPEAPRSNELCKYMIAAHNRRTGKVCLYDSEVFTLNPHFPDEDEDKDEPDQTFSEKIDDLTSAFGSMKKRRAMESRIKNKIEGAALDTALSSVVEDVLSKPNTDFETTQPSSHESGTLPPYDKDATEPAGVYSLDDIISQPEYQAVEGPAQIFIDSNKDTIKEWRDNKQYPKYILDALSMLPFEPEARKHRAICLMYLHYMIQLFLKNSKDLRTKKDCLPSEFPKIVQTSLLNNFTLVAERRERNYFRKDRCMPARLKDKLLSYICILCMILEDFMIDFGCLMTDMKVTQNRMTTILRSVGCTCKVQKKEVDGVTINVNTATLTVPLKFPEEKTPMKKRR